MLQINSAYLMRASVDIFFKDEDGKMFHKEYTKGHEDIPFMGHVLDAKTNLFVEDINKYTYNRSDFI